MNMYFHEIKMYRKFTLVWTVVIVGLIVAFMSIYPTYAAASNDLTAMLKGMGDEMLAAFGVFFDTFFTVAGFYSFIFLYIVLCAGIMAMIMGVSIISKENRCKTSDFLLTKPVKRTAVITAKLAACITNILFINVCVLISSILIANIVKDGDYSSKVLVLISLSMFFIQLLFMTLGMFLAVAVPKIKSPVGISLAVVFTAFVIQMLGSALDEKIIKLFSPFQYFNTEYIMQNHRYDTPYVILCLAVTVIAIAASYLIYIRRDVHAVS